MKIPKAPVLRNFLIKYCKNKPCSRPGVGAAGAWTSEARQKRGEGVTPYGVTPSPRFCLASDVRAPAPVGCPSPTAYGCGGKASHYFFISLSISLVRLFINFKSFSFLRGDILPLLPLRLLTTLPI